MHFKLCDLLEKDVYIGAMFRKLGVTCPVFGEYHLLNMTIPTENFPYVVPFEKTRADVFINRTAPHGMTFPIIQYQCLKVVPERISLLYIDKEEIANIKAYYLHNEYRRSFVEMHFKVCDLLEKEVYIGGMFKKLG
ncbi:Pseudaminic acid synthase, partial [Operophtera brumata]